MNNCNSMSNVSKNVIPFPVFLSNNVFSFTLRISVKFCLCVNAIIIKAYGLY